MDAVATAQRVKELREQAGMEVLELAFRAGVNPRTIERIEAGGVTPRKATLRVIFDVLGEKEAA